MVKFWQKNFWSIFFKKKLTHHFSRIHSYWSLENYLNYSKYPTSKRNIITTTLICTAGTWYEPNNLHENSTRSFTFHINGYINYFLIQFHCFVLSVEWIKKVNIPYAKHTFPKMDALNMEQSAHYECIVQYAHCPVYSRVYMRCTHNFSECRHIFLACCSEQCGWKHETVLHVNSAKNARFTVYYRYFPRNFSATLSLHNGIIVIWCKSAFNFQPFFFCKLNDSGKKV